MWDNTELFTKREKNIIENNLCNMAKEFESDVSRLDCITPALMLFRGQVIEDNLDKYSKLFLMNYHSGMRYFTMRSCKEIYDNYLEPDWSNRLFRTLHNHLKSKFTMKQILRPNEYIDYEWDRLGMIEVFKESALNVYYNKR